MLYTALIVLGVILDQVVKYLVRAHIPLGTSLPFIPHVLDLSYIQNRGAAFSMFSEHTWVLTLLSLAASVVMAVLMVKVFKDPRGRIPLAMVLSGAVGNLIDRALFGFVTDMFATTFMKFPVFNVADIFITVGGVLFCIYFAFCYDMPEGKEKKRHDDAPAADR